MTARSPGCSSEGVLCAPRGLWRPENSRWLQEPCDLQGITVAAIMALIPLPEVLKLGGLSGATRIRWPLFGVACANAISDFALDAFALRQVPEEWQHLPAVCQLVGIFVGKTAAKSRGFSC